MRIQSAWHIAHPTIKPQVKMSVGITTVTKRAVGRLSGKHCSENQLGLKEVRDTRIRETNENSTLIILLDFQCGLP